MRPLKDKALISHAEVEITVYSSYFIGVWPLCQAWIALQDLCFRWQFKRTTESESEFSGRRMLVDMDLMLGTLLDVPC